MQIISFRLHAVYDYIISLFMVLMPWIFGFAHNSTAMWVTVVFGIIYFLNTIFTGYRLAFFHFSPMYQHLGIDCVWGMILAAAPWLFGFYQVVFIPHLIVGLIIPILALMTRIPKVEAD